MGWRVSRAAAPAGVFVLGAVAGFACEGARARRPASDVIATLAARAPAGEALPGLDAVLTGLDPRGAPLWSRVCSGSGALGEPAVAVAPSGRVALAITFQGALDCGAGPVAAAGGPDDFDAILLVLEASGDPAWSRGIADVGPQSIAAVAFDPWGNILVAGSFHGTVDLGGPPLTAHNELDVLAAKLDPGGDLLWQRRIGRTGRNVALDVAVTPVGRTLLLARGSPDIERGAGPSGPAEPTTFLAEIDARGTALWSRALAGVQPSLTDSIQDSDHSVSPLPPPASPRFRGLFR
jgi:hypothetical protein